MGRRLRFSPPPLRGEGALTARRGRSRALIVLLIAGASACVLALHIARGSLPERLLAPSAIEVRYREGSVAHVRLAPDGRVRIPVRLAEVDPAYVQALVALEDRRFWTHPGVDPAAVGRAIVQDVRAGEIVSGASTLTMQLARLLEPKPRTLRSKVSEALVAFRLEARLTKDQILEDYLTFAPYGGNIEGIEAASLLYFGHRADQLSTNEIAILLAVPQDPTHRRPHPDHEKALRDARDRVLARLDGARDHAGFAPDALARAKTEPVPTGVRTVPREAPHAAVWLSALAPSGAPIETTLDHGIQATVERTIQRAKTDWAVQGIHNAAVVVVDHTTAEIQALVGNPDFFDAIHGGQIVGFDVPRSPGSTLKPFVYALALDRGQSLPEQLSLDVPVSYRGYAPENFDGHYDGLVSLEQALARSLNVPFVLQLEQMGMEPFLALLQRGGIRSEDLSPGKLGLSAVIGGMEITPLELAGLYVALANDGQARDLHVLRGPDTSARTLFTPGAAWLTRRALAIRDRPDFAARRELRAEPRGIHWKTGTSFGHRDAWAVGSNERYTVVVWAGNFDRTPSVHLVGAETPAPVLFDLLEALSVRGSAHFDPPPGDLVEVPICALSGHPAGAACPETRTVVGPVNSIPTERCPYHQRVEVDVATGLRVGPACRAGKTTRLETALIWPTRVRRWLKGLDSRALAPDWAPGCADAPSGATPVIRSPEDGSVALLVPGMASDSQEISLEADAQDGELAWFVDGRLLGRVRADERLWWPPTPGTHDIAVQDPAGRSSHVSVVVRSLR
jgi:penicillin-binding protein 1C